MPDAVIIAACRTPIGTAGKGTLAGTDAFDLADVVVRESLRRSGIEPDAFDDVILGESLYGGGDIARYAAVRAGLVNAPGVSVNRWCASGLAAISMAAAEVSSGMSEVVLAGGVNSSSTGPRVLRQATEEAAQGEVQWSRWLSPSHPDTADAPNMDMSITVGWNAAVAAGVSREEMDAWALRSHRMAIAAIDSGSFAEEIVPVPVVNDDRSVTPFEVDEHPRRTTTADKLAALTPLHPEIPGFSITAGNASGVNDGAAAVVVASREMAERRGRAPLAIIRAWASVGVEPRSTGMANTVVIPKALKKAGLDLSDVDLFEINEAFASVVVGTIKQLDLDPDKVNVVGSGCSLGHPIAASGARMITSLIYELGRRGGGTGVAAMCAGGGMGSAIVIEVPAP
jgi:acetyl-CoA acetyltransferase family protein